MTKNLLLAGLSSLLVVMCFAQGSHGQEQTRPALDQQAPPQPPPAPSAKASKQPGPPADREASTTVGTATSAPLNVKEKLHYFGVESFRPGVYPVAAFYDGLTMANPPKAYPREWRPGFPRLAPNYGAFIE